jgi:glycosyltransferase involved in cell wall biosynthesis|tara:strand:+ start:580 stop:1338 length:759 start_codon:yes stop_codon:yes gene_type:complete
VKLTLIVPTFNEEEVLTRCLESAIDLVDEILVVDSFSTDGTLEIAKSFDAKIIQREYENSASQKNWAIPQALNSWILLLDADEWLTNELHDEISLIISQKTEPIESGFWIYRSNHFLGKRVRFSGWQGDKVIRLFKRDECAYESQSVHSEIVTKGKLSTLSSRMNHDTFKGIPAWENKLIRYADWQANDYHKRMGEVTVFHTLVKPAYRFIKHFILSGGFLDGYVGYRISKYAAWSVSLRYQKVLEIRSKHK